MFEQFRFIVHVEAEDFPKAPIVGANCGAHERNPEPRCNPPRGLATRVVSIASESRGMGTLPVPPPRLGELWGMGTLPVPPPQLSPTSLHDVNSAFPARWSKKGSAAVFLRGGR